MIVSPEQAGKKRCCGPANCGAEFLNEANRYQRWCLGPDCMAWRWVEVDVCGYCGLAGNPQAGPSHPWSGKDQRMGKDQQINAGTPDLRTGGFTDANDRHMISR